MKRTRRNSRTRSWARLERRRLKLRDISWASFKTPPYDNALAIYRRFKRVVRLRDRN